MFNATALACFGAIAACRQGSADLHPVHVRNIGLLQAWEQWAQQRISESGQTDAANFLTRLRLRFSENDNLMKHILLRATSQNGNMFQKSRQDAVEGDAMFATAALMYSHRPNVLLELTPALEQLMTGSDLGDDIPAAQLRPPAPACYIRFGTMMQQAVALPVDDGIPANHIEGAYVFETVDNGNRAISVVAIYAVDAHAPMGISSLDFVIKDEQEALLEVIHRQCSASAPSPPLLAQQTALAQLCTKVFLYWSLEQASRVTRTPYSEAMRQLHGKGARKAGKLRRQMEHLYDSVVLGPPALPDHLRKVVGEMSPHWRRGHFRMQSCGPQMSQRKIIFIAPTVVRADRLSTYELP